MATDPQRHCTRCGTAVVLENAFCGSCGSRLVSAQSVPTSAPATTPARPSGGISTATVALVAIAVIGVVALALLGTRQAELSDVARVWCLDHQAAVIDAGTVEGIFPADEMTVTVGEARFGVGSLRRRGVTSAEIIRLLDPATVMHDWQAADRESFETACKRAFTGR